VLAVPMIGTLDSSRTQVVMETLLQRIVDTGSELAIIDITGVPTVDTLVAQHLLKTVSGHPPDGRRMHHQRHPPADRADHRAPGHRPAGRRHQGQLADALALALKQRAWRITRRGQNAPAMMDRIPILQMGSTLLVTIQVDMQDQTALALQDDLANKIAAPAPRAC
jgi:anti-anti-sigma regulatory factor